MQDSPLDTSEQPLPQRVHVTKRNGARSSLVFELERTRGAFALVTNRQYALRRWVSLSKVVPAP